MSFSPDWSCFPIACIPSCCIRDSHTTLYNTNRMPLRSRSNTPPPILARRTSSSFPHTLDFLLEPIPMLLAELGVLCLLQRCTDAQVLERCSAPHADARHGQKTYFTVKRRCLWHCPRIQLCQHAKRHIIQHCVILPAIASVENAPPGVHRCWPAW